MKNKYYEIAKRNYESGNWTTAMLRRLVELGRITQDEYDEIVKVSS